MARDELQRLKQLRDRSDISKKIDTKERSSVVKRDKNFIEEGAADVKDYVINSVVMPTIKDMIYNAFAGILDIVKDSIEAKIFGIDDLGRNSSYRSISNRRRRNREPIPFNSIYDRDDIRNRRRSRSRDVMDYEDYYFTDMFEAKRAKEDIYDIYEDRGGYLYVADYKKIIGYKDDEINQTDYEWGWYNISTLVIKPARHGGFMIDMPRPRPLDF